MSKKCQTCDEERLLQLAEMWSARGGRESLVEEVQMAWHVLDALDLVGRLRRLRRQLAEKEKKIDRLDEEIGSWHEASGLIVNGDPAPVTPDMLEADRQKDEAEITSLKADNAGLKGALLPFASYAKARDGLCAESPPTEIISALPDGTTISLAHFREAEQARLPAGGQEEDEKGQE